MTPGIFRVSLMVLCRCVPVLAPRIFRVLGQPSAAGWPELEALPHWRDNTDNMRAARPEYPPRARLAQHIADSWSGPAAGHHCRRPCGSLMLWDLRTHVMDCVEFIGAHASFAK